MPTVCRWAAHRQVGRVVLAPQDASDRVVRPLDGMGLGIGVEELCHMLFRVLVENLPRLTYSGKQCAPPVSSSSFLAATMNAK